MFKYDIVLFYILLYKILEYYIKKLCVSNSIHVKIIAL